MYIRRACLVVIIIPTVIRSESRAEAMICSCCATVSICISHSSSLVLSQLILASPLCAIWFFSPLYNLLAQVLLPRFWSFVFRSLSIPSFLPSFLWSLWGSRLGAKRSGTGQRTLQIPHCESSQKWQGPGNYNGWRKKMAPWYGRSVGRPAKSATVSLPLSPATFKRVYQGASWWLIAGITANLDRPLSRSCSNLFDCWNPIL